MSNSLKKIESAVSVEAPTRDDLAIATIAAKMKRVRRMLNKAKALHDKQPSEPKLLPPSICAAPNCHRPRVGGGIYCSDSECQHQRLMHTKAARQSPSSDELYRWSKSSAVQNRYYSVADCFRQFNLVRKDFHSWYLTDNIIGQINGLPQSRGTLIAANGVDCLIRTPSGHFLGHVAWFKPEVNLTDNASTPQGKAQATRLAKLLNAYTI